MIRCGEGTRRRRESRLGKALGLLPEIMEEVAALKVLQPVPLCPALDVLMQETLVQESGPFSPATGVSLRSLSACPGGPLYCDCAEGEVRSHGPCRA